MLAWCFVRVQRAVRADSSSLQDQHSVRESEAELLGPRRHDHNNDTSQKEELMVNDTRAFDDAHSLF